MLVGEDAALCGDDDGGPWIHAGAIEALFSVDAAADARARGPS